MLYVILVKLTVTGRAIHASNKHHHDTDTRKETGTMKDLTTVSIINNVLETILPLIDDAYYLYSY